MLPQIKTFIGYITRRISLDHGRSMETKLDRCLTTSQLIFYGISQMIGAGIYVLTGHMIKNRVGSASNLSFLLSGIVSIFTGLCYCEFATLIPKAGSCYTYTYLVIGELPAFIIGWTLIMDFIISLSSVSKGFSGALNLLTNNTIKNFTLTYLPLTKNSNVWDLSVDIVAALLLIALFLFSLSGANWSMNINSFLAIVQLCFLLTVIISCFVYGSSNNYVADGGYLPFGVGSIFQGAGIAIFAYSGFESLANSAEETKDPIKSIPTALFTSLGIVILLYVTASTGLSYLVPRLQIDEIAPFIAGFKAIGARELYWVSGIGTLIATGASKLTVIYLIPRQIYAMAHDGLLFTFLGKVNDSCKVPIPALVVGLLLSLILSMFVNIQILADVTSMGIVLSFTFIGINLMIFRYLYREETNETKGEDTMSMRVETTSFLITRKAFGGIFLGLILSIIFFGLSFFYIYNLSNIIGMVFSVLFATFFLICVGLLSLYKPMTTHDGFMSPLMPFTPIITISLNLCLLISLPSDTWIRFLVWISIGLLIYFAYGIRNSRLSQVDEEHKPILKMEDTKSDEKEDKIQ